MADVTIISDLEALDAYSRTVTSVAERLRPSVASLQLGRVLAGGRSAEGRGSAVVISADGYLVTSAHVVGTARDARLTLADGRSGPVSVVGRDALSDLAVVRTTLPDLMPAEL